MEHAKDYAVVYYSLSGHSETLARAIAQVLDGEVIALTVDLYSTGWLGYLRAGFDSLRQTSAPLKSNVPDLSARKGVVICGPVWTSYPAVPLRSFLKRAPALPDRVGLCLTGGEQSDQQKALDMAQADLGRKFTATGFVSNREEGTPQMARTVEAFCAQLRGDRPRPA